jgi:hypothetical protein
MLWMALPCSVRSAGQAPSAAHLVFTGDGVSAGAGVAGSGAPATFSGEGAGEGAREGGEDGAAAGIGMGMGVGMDARAGFGAVGAFASAGAGRGGIFSPWTGRARWGAAGSGSAGPVRAAAATGGALWPLSGRIGSQPFCRAQNTAPAPPSRVNTTAYAT